LQGNAEFGDVHPKPTYRCDSAPKTAASGDILLSVRAPVGELNVADQTYGIGRGLAAIRAHPGALSPRYLWWCVCASIADLRSVATGSTYDAVSADDIGDLPIPLATETQQQAIAYFLDRETARIDALIAAKRRMNELLEIRKNGLREAVVERLTKSAPLTRLQNLLIDVDERLGTAEPPPLLSVSIHFGVIPFAEANPDRLPRADELSNYKRCRAGDIVLNRMRAFQGGLGCAPSDGLVSPDYAVLRPTRLAIPTYVYQLLRSPWFVGQMEAWLRGIGSSEQGNVRTPRVNWADLRTIAVPCPAVSEQAVVASEIGAKLLATSAAQVRLNDSLALLVERRHALITAAVTGEMGILGATA
jgi:type I restriction enzyme S subunit